MLACHACVRRVSPRIWGILNRVMNSFWLRDRREHSKVSGSSTLSAVWPPLFLFCLALIARLISVFRTAAIFNDGPIFLDLASAFSEGRWHAALAHDYHPLYPFMVHLFTPFVGDPERAGVWVSLISGSLAVVALYAFLTIAWERRIAFVGAFILAVQPYAIRFSADVQSDSLYLMFFLAAVAFLAYALREARPAAAFAAGLLSGLAYLTRPEGLGVALIGFALIFALWLRRSWRSSSAIKVSIALWVGVALAGVPYLGFLREINGGWQLSQKKSLFVLLGIESGEWTRLDPGGMTPGSTLSLVLVLTIFLLLFWRLLKWQRSKSLPRRRIGSVTLALTFGSLFLAAFVLAPDRVAVFATDFISTLRPELALLLAIGIASRAPSAPGGRSFFVAAFTALYAVVLFGLLLQYGYLSRRHMLPPLTLLFGYVATGVWVLAGWLQTWLRGAKSPGRPLGLILILALVATMGLAKAWRDHRHEQLPGRLAAEWLRDQTDGKGVLATDKSKLGYYADLQWRPLRSGGELRSGKRLRREGVRFLILETHQSEDPMVVFRDTRLPPMRERYRVEQGDHRAVVVELLRSGS